MKLIVITADHQVADEEDTLNVLLEKGAQIHIRKPSYTSEALSSLIEAIPKQYYEQICLHSRADLAFRSGLGGLHLKSDQHLPVEVNWQDRLSKSFHNIEDILSCELSLDYCFLSPLFESISKKGYDKTLNRDTLKGRLKEANCKTPVYALGGITTENLHEVQKLGFSGAAVLGTIWQWTSPTDRLAVYENLLSMCHEQ